MAPPFIVASWLSAINIKSLGHDTDNMMYRSIASPLYHRLPARHRQAGRLIIEYSAATKLVFPDGRVIANFEQGMAAEMKRRDSRIPLFHARVDAGSAAREGKKFEAVEKTPKVESQAN